VTLVADALGEQPAWASLVAAHHERLDGSGYPTGRRGIHLSRAMRIFGLADTFATLVAPGGRGNVRTADDAVTLLPLAARGRADDELLWALVRLLEAGHLLPVRHAPKLGAR
jgi:HD-GYP domain-containing protein (c-di-GMP phosphodiesterase class II)